MANSPVKPNDFKNLIPSPGGNLCDKISKLIISLPSLSFQLVSWILNEDGSFTDDFKTAVCQALADIGCAGGSGNPDANPNMPAPTNVNATDGTYSDKVLVTWNAVTPPSGIAAVTKYKVYRAPSDVLAATSSTLIATVDAPTLQYEDTTAVPGTTYNYWVVATNDSDTSNYGGPNSGYAGIPTTTLPAISDLIASQGFSATNDGVISLWWTPPSGATKYDIYRHTANDFASATKIMSNVTPETGNVVDVTIEQAYDNTGAIVAFHTPPSGSTKYYFWVVAKKDSPPAVSPESNAAQGWVNITTDEPGILDRGSLNNGDSYVVPGGVVRIKMVVYGQGGGGAGGGNIYGGGGGGSAPACSIEFAVVATDTIDLATTPNQDTTGNAPASTNGTNGAVVDVKLNGVSVLTIIGGSGGVYSSSGNGAGGAKSTGASGSALVTAWPTLDGNAASGSAGGRGGAAFPQAQLAAAHFNGVTGWEADAVAGNGGGGSYSDVGTPGAVGATGGKGIGALAIYAAFTV